jgi:hypothetical protein
MTAPDIRGPGMPLFFLAFAVFLGGPLLLEYYRVWHRLEPGGMRSQPLLKDACSVKWKDVTRVSYSQGSKWFIVETANGTKVRRSVMLVGLPAFARTVLHEVPRDRIEAQAVPVLERTAAGNPPPIWM